MTRDDFIGRLETYLDDYEGHTPLPEGVRDAVRASLPTVKQSGPLRGPERFATMTIQVPAPARYGLAAAAVVAAIVLGASFFGRGSGGGIGGPPESSTQPSLSPSAEPSADGASSLFEVSPTGDIPAGRYYLDVDAYPARIEFEVPAGWWHFYPTTRTDSDAQAILVNSLDTGAANGSAWGVAFTVVGEVRVDPCDPEAGTMDPSVTESIDALASAFSSWPDFPANVEEVSIGGYDGKRVELSTASSTCAATVLTTPAGFDFEIEPARSDVPAPPQQFTFLDVEGSVLVIWTTDYPGTNYFEIDGGASYDPQAHADDQVELHAILDSIVLEPRTAGTD